MKEKACSAEQSMYYSLRYELAEFTSSDTEKRWNINKKEKEVVEKWMKARMEEIGKKLSS